MLPPPECPPPFCPSSGKYPALPRPQPPPCTAHARVTITPLVQLAPKSLVSRDPYVTGTRPLDAVARVINYRSRKTGSHRATRRAMAAAAKLTIGPYTPPNTPTPRLPPPPDTRMRFDDQAQDRKVTAQCGSSTGSPSDLLSNDQENEGDVWRCGGGTDGGLTHCQTIRHVGRMHASRCRSPAHPHRRNVT